MAAGFLYFPRLPPSRCLGGHAELRNPLCTGGALDSPARVHPAPCRRGGGMELPGLLSSYLVSGTAAFLPLLSSPLLPWAQPGRSRVALVFAAVQ